MLSDPWWNKPLFYLGNAAIIAGIAVFVIAASLLRYKMHALASVIAGTAVVTVVAWLVPRFIIDLTAAIVAVVLLWSTARAGLDAMRHKRRHAE